MRLGSTVLRAEVGDGPRMLRVSGQDRGAERGSLWEEMAEWEVMAEWVEERGVEERGVEARGEWQAKLGEEEEEGETTHCLIPRAARIESRGFSLTFGPIPMKYRGITWVELR